MKTILTIVIIMLALLTAVDAKQIDCRSQSAAERHYGTERLVYRSVDGEHCWYPRSMGRVAKSQFIHRASGEGPRVSLTSQHTVAQERVDGAAGSTPAPVDSSYNDMINDAFVALTGKSEKRFAFDQMWDDAMHSARGK